MHDHQGHGLVMLTYTDAALARAAELGRRFFPDVDTRSTEDRCFIGSFAIGQALEAQQARQHGVPWAMEDGSHGMCLQFPAGPNADVKALLTALAGYGFTVRGSLLTETGVTWWRSDGTAAFERIHVDDIGGWLESLEAPTVPVGLQALLEDLHPDDLSERDSRSIYTRLGLAYLGEHALHDPEHDVYRDLALLAATEVAFPDTLPITCFHSGLDAILSADVYS